MTAKKASAKVKKAPKALEDAKVGRKAESSASKPAVGKALKTELVKPKKQHGGAREGAGKPRFVVDLGLVEKLAQIHASQEEIAATLGVSVGFVSERMKNDEAFAAAHARGWSNGKLNLRRKQLEKAMAGDATMQIWLGKNMLGQTDKAEVKTHQTFSFVVDLS